jgi:hypothetical protein
VRGVSWVPCDESAVAASDRAELSVVPEVACDGAAGYDGGRAARV